MIEIAILYWNKSVSDLRKLFFLKSSWVHEEHSHLSYSSVYRSQKFNLNFAIGSGQFEVFMRGLYKYVFADVHRLKIHVGRRRECMRTCNLVLKSHSFLAFAWLSDTTTGRSIKSCQVDWWLKAWQQHIWCLHSQNINILVHALKHARTHLQRNVYSHLAAAFYHRTDNGKEGPLNQVWF